MLLSGAVGVTALGGWLPGMGGNVNSVQAADAEDLPWIELSYVGRSPEDAQRVNVQPAEDVVTPYLEEKFHIRVKEVVQGPADSTIQQNVAMWSAAGSMPDVIECDSQSAAILMATGKFADLTDAIRRNMPNYIERCWPEEYWEYTNYEGKQYSVMSFDEMKNPPVATEEDPWYEGLYAHGLVVREDILAELGYEFTPIDEIRAATTDQGIKPTVEQMAIEPAIDTPEALYELMKQIQESEIKAPNGQNMIPMTLMSWMTHHLGCMFDFGRWRIGDDGEVDGMLGCAGAQDYMEWLNKVYNEGLLDPDYILQSDSQYQEKIGSGTAAIAFYAGFDIKAAEQSLAQLDPDARLRFIPWPKENENQGFYDVVSPVGYWHSLIRADMPQEDIDRILQMWDYMFSDEGQDLISWGPEEAGLWEIVDGVKKFKDPQVAEDCLSRTRNSRGADYYGLCEASVAAKEQNFSPLVLTCPGSLNYQSFFRSYDAELDFDNVTRNLLGANGKNFDGRAANGDNSELVSNVENWYWGEFMSRELAKILQAEPGEGFEAAWEEVYNAFVTETNYGEAKAAMEIYFEKYPPVSETE